MKRLLLLVFAISAFAYGSVSPHCRAIANAVVTNLTRHLDPAWDKVFVLGKSEEALIPAVVRDLKAADWGAPLLQPDHPSAEGVLRAAFHALNRDQISQNQFSTLVMRWQLATELKSTVRTVPLLDPKTKKLTPLAREIFDNEPESAESNEILQGLRKLKGSEVPTFEAFLNASPDASEAILSYAIIPATHLRGPAARRSLSLTRTLGFAPGGQFFVRDDIPKIAVPGHDSIVMNPSLTAMQALLNTIHGKNALELVPELGMTPLSVFATNLIDGKRTLGLSFPGLPVPDTADNISTDRVGFTQHDFFHALQGSAVAPEYRFLMARAYLSAVEAYEQRKEPDGRVQILPGVLMNPAAIVRKKLLSLDGIGVQVADVSPKSFLDLPHSAPPQQKLLHDLGSVNEGHLGFLVVDMTRNQALYQRRGIDVQALIKSLGPEAVSLSAKVK